MPNTNRATTQARDAQVIGGIQKHLQTTPSLPLAASTYTPADLVKLFQSRIDSANAAAAASASWHAAVLADRTLNAKLSPVLRALRQYAINVYGETSPVLADFGFDPPKRTTRTPEQKAAAAAKAKATRQARHTMGKIQKKDVKGAVTATLVVTPIGASPPTTPTAPAAGSTASAPVPMPAPATPTAPAPAPAPASPPLATTKQS